VCRWAEAQSVGLGRAADRRRFRRGRRDALFRKLHRPAGDRRSNDRQPLCALVMTEQSQPPDEPRLYKDLGFQRHHPAWAKVEIFFGLAAVSAGHLCGVYAIVHLEAALFWAMIAASLLLQSLGGYLALAGHRSHVYQSNNKLTAWLAAQFAQRDG